KIHLDIHIIVERFEQLARSGFYRVPLLFCQVDAEETVRRDQVDQHHQRYGVGQLQQVPKFSAVPVHHDRALNTTLVDASMRNPTLKKYIRSRLSTRPFPIAS